MEPNPLVFHDASGRVAERPELLNHPLRSTPTNARLALDPAPVLVAGAGAAPSPMLTGPGPALRAGAAAGPSVTGYPPPASANGYANGSATALHSGGGNSIVVPSGALRSAGGSGAAAGALYAPAATELREAFYLARGKRWLDVAGALIGLVGSAPILLVAAAAIKLESRGPMLYCSKRIGRGGRPFTFLKLRSMVDGADSRRHHLSHLNETDGPVFKMSRDPRVTRVGRFLRATSIDELPQLWNVLRGDMSLVGPRPPLTEEVAQYEPWQLRRLEVRPGITCLWQISGRSRIGFQEWMRLDLEYIRQQSLALDLRILIRTIPAVLSREGAY